jgi:hypothetical protein
MRKQRGGRPVSAGRTPSGAAAEPVTGTTEPRAHREPNGALCHVTTRNGTVLNVAVLALFTILAAIACAEMFRVKAPYWPVATGVVLAAIVIGACEAYS